MSVPLRSGLLKGLRRALIPFALAVVCFLAAQWGVDDMVGLLRGIGWILIVLGVVILVATVFDTRGKAERLDFTHAGYETQDRGKHQDSAG